MTLPLVVLAGLAIVGGGLNLPFTSDLHFLGHWLEPVLEGNERVIDVATGTKVGLALVATFVGLAGIALAARIYLLAAPGPSSRRSWPTAGATTAPSPPSWAARASRASRPWPRSTARWSTAPSTAWPESSGAAAAACGSSRSGFVRSYALGVGIGAVGLLAYFLTRISG